VIKVWDVQQGKLRRTLSAQHGLRAAALAPDGRHAAGAYADGWMRTWDLDDPSRPRAIRKSLGDYVVALAITPGGEFVIGFDAHDDVIRVWEIATGAVHTASLALQRKRGLIGTRVFCAARTGVVPGGTRLIAAGKDALMRIAKGEQVHSLQAHTTEIQTAALSIDGLVLPAAFPYLTGSG
jgi:hypothetical protein